MELHGTHQARDCYHAWGCRTPPHLVLLQPEDEAKMRANKGGRVGSYPRALCASCMKCEKSPFKIQVQPNMQVRARNGLQKEAAPAPLQARQDRTQSRKLP